jgi:hypothetical protein
MHLSHVHGPAGADEDAQSIVVDPTYLVTVYNQGDYIGTAWVGYDLKGAQIRYPTGYLSPGSSGVVKVASGATNVKADFYIKDLVSGGPDKLVTSRDVAYQVGWCFVMSGETSSPVVTRCKRQ